MSPVPAALRRPQLTPFLTGLIGWSCAAAVSAQGLPELARLALASDPAVAGAAAQVRAAEHRVTQAKASFGPTANLTLSATETRYEEAPNFDLRPFRSKQATLQVTQPLWRGALFPALYASRSQLLAAHSALAQAQSEALQRLVEAAFEVLKSRDALDLVGSQQVQGGQQLLAARRAFQVGTVAVTDVRDAEAKADTVAAQAVSVEAELAMRVQILQELVGQPTPGWLGRGLDGTQLPTLDPSLIALWLSLANTDNPQIAQARQTLEAAEAEIRKASLAHAPSAELSYNWSQTSDTGTITSVFPRAGVTSAVGVTFTVPLFASGGTEARVKESVAQRDKVQADLDAARRSVSLAVRQAFSGALSSIAHARSLETVVRSQEVALRANRRGYEVGTKVNLEVLDSQTKLFEAQRDLSRARYDAWNNYLKLKSHTGQLGHGDFETLDGLMITAITPSLITPRRAAP